MIYFLFNLFLAFAWMLINGAYGSIDFLIGFIISYFVLQMSQPFGLETHYFRKFTATLKLIAFFLKEMFVSVWQVAWDVMTPQHLSNPDIIHVPLDAKTDLEITLLANMVSLTPGTLSLDVTDNKKELIIHAMFADDHEQVIKGIKNGMEKKLLEVTRD
jgi:multicomponent Na+:H+ antiporter subunit E